MDTHGFQAPPPRVFQPSGLDLVDDQGRRTPHCYQGEIEDGRRLEKTVFVAVLEAVTPALRGQVWGLPASDVTLGRRGKRENTVALDDLSVSRAHATLVYAEGEFRLQAESAGSATLVNGAPPSERALQDGDSLQLGEIVLRFRPLTRMGMQVFSLGPFRIQLRGEEISEKAWRGQTSRHLLACLAAEWGQPCSVETLLEEFWPEVETERSRNNLNSVVSVLRAVIGPERLLRTQLTLQLVPQPGDKHDLGELEECLGQADRRALELYRAPYLEGFFQDFAVRRRDRLEMALVALSVKLAAQLPPEEALACSRRALEWDPCCQDATLHAMRACRALGRSQEAVRFYENCKAVLHKELQMEPSLELMREHQAALLSL